MVKVRKDLTGMVFGRLTVLEQDDDYVTPKGLHFARWRCQCSCEEKTVLSVIAYELTRTNRSSTRSCGCLARELTSERSRKPNVYNLDGEFGVGWTHNTNMEFYFDLEDYDLIKDFSWHTHTDQTGYTTLRAKIPGTDKSIKMSHLLGFKDYDHINRNSLDNRKANFREATNSQNKQNRSLFSNNTSGVTGVCWRKDSEKWRAEIRVNNQRICLGSFINKEDAIRSRLIAEVKYFGEFAPQKHLYEQYGIQTQQNDLENNK